MKFWEEEEEESFWIPRYFSLFANWRKLKLHRQNSSIAKCNTFLPNSKVLLLRFSFGISQFGNPKNKPSRDLKRDPIKGLFFSATFKTQPTPAEFQLFKRQTKHEIEKKIFSNFLPFLAAFVFPSSGSGSSCPCTACSETRPGWPGDSTRSSRQAAPSLERRVLGLRNSTFLKCSAAFR